MPQRRVWPRPALPAFLGVEPAPGTARAARLRPRAARRERVVPGAEGERAAQAEESKRSLAGLQARVVQGSGQTLACPWMLRPPALGIFPQNCRTCSVPFARPEIRGPDLSGCPPGMPGASLQPLRFSPRELFLAS